MKSILKKIVLLLVVLVTIKAEAQSFKAKQVDINIGLGFGSRYRVSSVFGYRPPISISGEYGITDEISIGVYLGYTGYSLRYTGSDYCNNGNGNGGYYTYEDTYSWSFYIIGLRGAYHFAKFVKDDKMDLYGGLMLGNTFYNYNYSTTSSCGNHIKTYYSTSGPHLAYALFAGGRYHFTDKIGGFGEIGYGISYLNIGLNIKIQK